jgi:tetratricopeptide (TPR) repeat protein
LARKNASRTEAPLPVRIDRALKQGRLPSALELAKQFAAEHPSPDSQVMLRKTYLALADQLIDRGEFKGAPRLLADAEAVCGDDRAWLESLAERWASVGEAPRALAILDRVPGSTAMSRVGQRLADWSMLAGDAARASLPDDLRGGFDIVRSAFAHYESGRDEEARQLLQKIGLQSPFLEWKILLRGLIAYSAGDDLKAVENWQRLDAGRMPARLAAPVRSRIDPTFRDAQPPETAAALASQFDRLHPHAIRDALRRLQRTLAGENGLGRSWPQITSIAGVWRQGAPALLARLAKVVYGLIVREGEQVDAEKYVRLFGPPAEDPEFVRCRAFICEQQDQLPTAHRLWQMYESWIARSPQRWPGAQGKRARALIWERMGHNALARLTAIADEQDEDDDIAAAFWKLLNRFQGDSGPVEPLRPTPEECFRRAAELAPERLAPATELFQVYLEDGRTAQAEKVARDLLKRFPNDVPTLAAMARLYECKGDTAKALEFGRRAVHAKPLDRQLSGPLVRALINHARALATEDDVEKAAKLLDEALSRAEQGAALAARSLLDVVRLKEGAEATTDQQPSECDPSLCCAAIYHRAVEAARIKHPKAAREPLEKALAETFTSGATLAEVVPLLEALEFYRQEPQRYHGQLTHEKKIHALVDKAIESTSQEDELVRAGHALMRLHAWRALALCVRRGQRAFARNPHFLLLEAELKLGKDPKRVSQYVVAELLRKVIRLSRAAPDGRYRPLLETVERLQREHPWLECYLSGRGDDLA